MVVIRNRVQVAAILALGAVMVLAILSMAFDASSVVESLFPFVLAEAFGAMLVRQARARIEVSPEGWIATAEGPFRRARPLGLPCGSPARIASSSEWGTIPGLIRRGTTSSMLLRAGAFTFRSSMWSSLNLLTDGIGLGLSGTGFLGC
jgi:hypothetical protein